MKTIINGISNTLQDTFDGKAWHGPNLLEIIEPISHLDATKATTNSHNIAELTHHIYAWRVYVLEHLKGNAMYEVADDFNFIKMPEVTAEKWQQLVVQLKESQRELLALLAEKDDAFLTQLVPNRDFDFYKLLNGLIHHDMYHAGQLILLRKM